MSGFELQWQDYTGWRATNLKQPHPSIVREPFASEEEAIRRKEELRAACRNVVATVVPVVPAAPKVTRKSVDSALTAAGYPKVAGGMRLT